MSCAMIKVFHSIVKCLGEEVGGLFWWRGEKLQMREGKQGSVITSIYHPTSPSPHPSPISLALSHYTTECDHHFHHDSPDIMLGGEIYQGAAMSMAAGLMRHKQPWSERGLTAA